MSSVTPFWNRIPRFFLYGINRNVLLILGAIAVANYFITGWLMLIVYEVIIIKYASEALQQTSQGNLSAPALSFSVINENLELPFKLFLVYLCYFYALGRLLEILPYWLLIPVIFIAILLLPAVVISLVISEEIGHALNPLNWFSITLRIGWPYLIMFLFLVLFGIVNTQLGDLLGSRLSSRSLSSFGLALDGYFMIVIFHLMGYIVLQYHEQLGHEAPGEQQQGGLDDKHSSPLMQKFLDEGNIPAALAELSSLIQDSPLDLELRRRMYVLLSSHGEQERLRRYAPHYVDMLMGQGRKEDAASVYLDSVERGDPFALDKAAHHLPIMQVLRMRRKPKQAILLAQGFHKRFPADLHTPELYLEMAQILSEELQRDDLARNALAYVLKNHPETPVVDEVKKYYSLLSQLNNPAG